MPVLQGLRIRLPDRDRYGDLQVRGPLPALPAPPASAVALRAWLATPVGTGRIPCAQPGKRVAPRPRVRPGQAHGWRRRAATAPEVRATHLPPVVRQPCACRR